MTDTDTDISPTISGLQLMLDQYSGKTPYVGYPKALQDGIATLRALSAALTQSRAETAAAYERAAVAVASVNEWSPYVAGSQESKAWIAGHIGATKLADDAIRALLATDTEGR